MKTGIELITKEREEQIEKHGFDAEIDKFYLDNELIKAALYAINPKQFEFPFEWDKCYRDKIRFKSRIEQLKVAGAFIAAEIDRLQYRAKHKF